MYAVRMCRILVAVIALLMVVGLVASAVESEEFDHQQEVHHCVTCCTTHHTAAPTTPAVALPRLTAASCLPLAAPCLYLSLVVRPPDPPPELLA
jgi:hypothetical protein